MIKKLKIISLFFLTFYIQSSENNTTTKIFSSIIELERCIQKLPIQDQENQRTLYLENIKNKEYFTSYYRDLAYEFILVGSDQNVKNLLLHNAFPPMIPSLNIYKQFRNLLIFEIIHQENIINFVSEYPVDEYSKEEFIKNFIEKFGSNRSERRVQKELDKAFWCMQYYERPIEISYFFDPKSSDKPLDKLKWVSFFGETNKKK